MRPAEARLVNTAARSYGEALQRLSELGSNRRTTHLFDVSPKADLNALAIPEMRGWLLRAGYSPEDLSRMRHIHVAGTKGKGSVCAHATAMLREYAPVGTFTSPHLVSPRERIAINGKPVSQDLFAKAFFEVWDRFTEAARNEGKPEAEAAGPDTKPFYFRFLTILAWHIYLSQGITDVVMECGIGGEYDATNVLPAEAVSAAVITQLGIDHVAMLGDTTEKIAWHKAGVIKPGVRAFTRKLDGQPAVMEVLRARAREKGGELVEVPDALVDAWGVLMALALMAVKHHLRMDSDPLTALDGIPHPLIVGLQQASLRGRCEKLQMSDVTWYLDGAHTKDSLEQVAGWFIPELDADESAVLVFNQQDRNATELLSGFLDATSQVTSRLDVFQHAIFTRNEHDKPAEEQRDVQVQRKAAALMNSRIPACHVSVCDNLPDALAEVKQTAANGAKPLKILVTGSLHLVGGVMRLLEPDSQL
ncbi:Mur ligase [Stachybotrys elegans]|uniref:tetrahydrofolate synthase n=1 Tax=Stachybotrys elegans TaxID=80388 RepID=A0A8K0WRD5_9HYPO|nr:Mur ligase [Stachybotrys elegans]